MERRYVCVCVSANIWYWVAGTLVLGQLLIKFSEKDLSNLFPNEITRRKVFLSSFFPPKRTPSVPSAHLWRVSPIYYYYYYYYYYSAVAHARSCKKFAQMIQLVKLIRTTTSATTIRTTRVICSAAQICRSDWNRLKVEIYPLHNRKWRWLKSQRMKREKKYRAFLHEENATEKRMDGGNITCNRTLLSLFYFCSVYCTHTYIGWHAFIDISKQKQHLRKKNNLNKLSETFKKE